ncbi:hypothetical protein LSAT2_011778 [Lamellibrachia satsuma]|nr:hypothetical protein LSAT2_011778 [Lamellibrachia satsuma]
MDVSREGSLMVWLVLVFMFAKQVLTTEDNIAVGRPARQSSLFDFGTPDRVVDGNINGNSHIMKSCSHTDIAQRPWWTVDLESERLVRSVHIYNRVECCSDRLHDLRVGLVNTWPTTGESSVIALDAICATLDGPHPQARVIIQCEENAIGRYLVIQIDGVNSDSYLTLCEVEVFGARRK